ncbi:MAG TPA: universal stress protein [Solirubrobacterales bacterium]|nr:universal stress protein [Solirubrobacterales bacterium]
MRLLVGIDHREGGRDALELARVLGASSDSSVLVVTVLFGGPLPMEYALLPEEESREAEPLFTQAREVLADMEVETHAYGGGSPAAILTTVAEREHFDAIVVGSPHRGVVGRVLLGSVAKSLLNGAPTDVAVAPKGFAQEQHDSLRNIAVGYDGAPESKLALQRAESLARASNARIKLVTVVKPPAPAPVMVPVASRPEFPPQPERVINEGVNSVDVALAAEGRRLDGDPATQLAAECAEGVDLLVLGSRGYGPVSRVLLGSVSRQLLPKAPCPVLVVSRP